MKTVGPEVALRRLSLGDWRCFKEIRLRALAEAPAAFGSTLEEARRLDEAGWRERLQGRAQFVAMRGPLAVGTAAGVAAESGAELISMWVDPTHRGTGVGDRLVRAVLDWASDETYRTVSLWVAAGNEAAERLYARNGFRRTGATQPMGDRRHPRCEFAMSRDLGREDQPGR